MLGERGRARRAVALVALVGLVLGFGLATPVGASPWDNSWGASSAPGTVGPASSRADAVAANTGSTGPKVVAAGQGCDNSARCGFAFELFGDSGQVTAGNTLFFSGANADATSVVIDASGTIFIVGDAGSDVGVVRIGPTGGTQAQTTFSNPFVGGTAISADGVALGPSGTIFVGGTATINGASNMFFGQFGSGLNFMQGANVIIGNGVTGSALVPSLDGSGFFLFGAADKHCAENNLTPPCAVGVSRFLPTGQMDDSFGLGGFNYTQVPPGNLQVLGGTMFPNGDLLVSGSQGGFPALWMLKPNGGALDPVFNGFGTFLGTTAGTFPSVDVDPVTGDVYVALDTGGGSNYFYVGVVSPFGRPEAPFGTGGFLSGCVDNTNSFFPCPAPPPPPPQPPLARSADAASTGRARAVKVRSDGKALVAGSLGGQMAVGRLQSGLIHRAYLPSSIRAVSITR